MASLSRIRNITDKHPVLTGFCLLCLQCQKQNPIELRKENSYEKVKRKEDHNTQGF